MLAQPGQPSRSGRPPLTVSSARSTRSVAFRPGHPCRMPRHEAGMELAPHLAPRRAPATDATVSVSWPIRTAQSRASTRWWQSKLPSPGAWGGTGVWVMADQAACNVVTT